MKTRHLVLVLILAPLLLVSPPALAQHEWQKPKPPVPRADLEAIIGPLAEAEPSRDLRVLWVWGYDAGHRPGAHDYLRVRDLMVDLLRDVPRVTVEPVYLFPERAQFERADLVVLYLHLPQLTAGNFKDFKDYIRGGGGVVALHETAILRPATEGVKLAACLGMAWDEGRSQWGAIFEDITVKNDHEIFRGFPDKLRIVDEFYWELNRAEGVEVLGQVRTGPPRGSRGPLPASRLSEEGSPMFWTFELGRGRVFGTTTGHNTFTYDDPEFRIVLFRAMAWALREKPDPFLPLVFKAITDADGMVGTTDDRRGWKGKLRRPPPLPRVARMIDTHIHLYDPRREAGVPWPPPDDEVLYHPHLPAEFRRVSANTGLTGAVVVEASDRLEDNRWVLDLVSEDDTFIALVGNIDPYREDFEARLLELKQDPRFVGVRARNGRGGQPVDFSDAKVLQSLRALARHGLSVDILVNGGGTAAVVRVDRLAREIPGLRIVVDHVLGYDFDGRPPPADWVAAVERLGENRNVWCKVSGLYQRSVLQPAPQSIEFYRDALDVLWANLGPDRLIFGSNWPCTKNSGSYDSFVRLVNTYFSEKGPEACERYFWKNAAEAYNLDLD